MSRMDKRDIVSSLNEKIERKELYDSLLGNCSYEESTLYVSDILNNDSKLEEVKTVIKQLTASSNDVYNWSTGTFTTLNRVCDQLNEIPKITHSMLEEATNVRDKIYKSSHKVYNEKLEIYNGNNRIIDSKISSINDCISRYDAAHQSLVQARISWNALMENDPNRPDIKKRINEYQERMEEAINSAEILLNDMESKLKENETLLESYLKKVL